MHQEQYRDTLEFSHLLYAGTPRELEFRATTLSEALRWQDTLRAKLIELMGGFPQKPCDLQPQVLASTSFGPISVKRCSFRAVHLCRSLAIYSFRRV